MTFTDNWDKLKEGAENNFEAGYLQSLRLKYMEGFQRGLLLSLTFRHFPNYFIDDEGKRNKMRLCDQVTEAYKEFIINFTKNNHVSEVEVQIMGSFEELLKNSEFYNTFVLKDRLDEAEKERDHFKEAYCKVVEKLKRLLDD